MNMQKAIADRFGYFWLHCPVCGQEFGGHQILTLPDRPNVIPHPSGKPGHYKTICPKCTATGRGYDPMLAEVSAPRPAPVDTSWITVEPVAAYGWRFVFGVLGAVALVALITVITIAPWS